MPSDNGRRLDAELERMLVWQLVRAAKQTNYTFFGGKLKPPAIRLIDSQTLLGRWVSSARAIELSRAFVLERPWGEVLEVLRHEMAHQYVEELLGVSDEPPHGPTFRRVCAERAIDARAAGAPEPAEVDRATARLLEKVRRLLALAGSDNQHEAELAMRRARELMLKHQLELPSEGRRYVFRYLEPPRKRMSRAERMIAGMLGELFFVEVVLVPVYLPFEGKTANAIEICGTEENVAMAEYVHAFTLGTAERLWQEARARDPRLGGRDRASYMAGVVAGFRETLEKADEVQRSEGLVWVGDTALESFYRRRHPNLRTIRRAQLTRHTAQALGRQAGRQVVLHRPLEGGRRSAGQGPRLLPGG